MQKNKSKSQSTPPAFTGGKKSSDVPAFDPKQSHESPNYLSAIAMVINHMFPGTSEAAAIQDN
jgi:hypothetical protein